jgi:hypothetical protein
MATFSLRNNSLHRNCRHIYYIVKFLSRKKVAIMKLSLVATLFGTAALAANCGGPGIYYEEHYYWDERQKMCNN